MKSATDAGDEIRPGVVLLAALGGFAVGEAVATTLVGVGAAVTHAPGGVLALARSATPPWWVNVASLAGLWVGFALAVVVAARAGGLVAWPGTWRLRWSDLRFVLLGVASQILIALAYLPFHVHDFGKPVTRLFGGAHGATFALLVLLTMVGAPIAEEWFFRGVLLRGLVAAFGRVGARLAVPVGIVASGVLFAAAHGEPAQFAGLAAFGVVLALVAWRTRRLAASAVVHVSFNGVAIVALLAQRWHG